MNKFQLFALVGGFANALLMVLFPPYDRLVIGRIAPNFEAYYFVLQAPAGRTVNAGLLAIELLAVAFGVMMAWILLRGSRNNREYPQRRPQSVVLVLAAAAFALIVVFPPFETMLLPAMGAPTFHGFDVVFAGGAARGIFVPMLFLELLLFALNVSVFWLLFDVMERNRSRPGGGSPQAAGGEMQASSVNVTPPIGRRSEERRQGRDPAFQGPNRRGSRERRTR